MYNARHDDIGMYPINVKRLRGKCVPCRLRFRANQAIFGSIYIDLLQHKMMCFADHPIHILYN